MDFNVSLKPDDNQEIKLGSNYLRIDSVAKVRSSTKDVVERSNRLYDRENNTFLFTPDEAVKVNTVTFLAFEELPEAARRYIATKSARIFHDRVVGSGELHRFFQEDEQLAWSELLEYEGVVGDFTIFDDYDVYRILERDTGRQRRTTVTTT